MSYLNRNRLKNFFINLKKYFKSEEFLNSMAISNAEIDNIANTAGYNDNGTGTVNYDFVPRSGGAVLTGLSLAHANATEAQHYCGGTSTNTGGHFTAFGKDHYTSGGWAAMRANNGTEDCAVNLRPDGTMTKTKGSSTKNFAMQEDTVPRSGGAVLTGTDYYKTTNNSYMIIGAGSNSGDGAAIALNGATRSTNTGQLILTPNNGTYAKDMRFEPNGTWTWQGSAVQITSDQRYKQQINAIDDKLLDAWKDVAPVQFKYNDAVEEKGDNARLHTGYVVQQIAEACQNNDVDIDNYGLYCHEVYPERTEEVTITNEDGTTKKETKVIEEASEHYSLRYTEALIVECAFLRREVERLTERVTKLESRKKKTTS